MHEGHDETLDEQVNELIIYRQKRRDLAIRTGIIWNGETIHDRFDPGPPDRADDPLGTALDWYVDLRCRGPHLPHDLREIRTWLVANQATIVRGFRDLSEELSAGQDPQELPFQWGGFEGAPRDVSMEIVWSCIRRLTARDIAKVLGEIAGRWPLLIDELTSEAVPG